MCPVAFSAAIYQLGETNFGTKRRKKRRKMKSVTKLVLALAICLVVLVPHQIAAEQSKGKDLINKVCAKTPSKDACTKTLESDPRSEQAELKELAMISMKAAKANATEIISHVKTLMIDDKLEPETQQGLADCYETLVDAEEQIQDAIAALLADVNKDAQKWLQVALAAISTCESYLNGNDRILLQKEENFGLLCNIALSLSQQLVDGV